MTKAENIPKIGTEKADPHGFNTTLCKRITSATLTVRLATALDASTKGWGGLSAGKKGKREIKEKNIKCVSKEQWFLTRSIFLKHSVCLSSLKTSLQCTAFTFPLDLNTLKWSGSLTPAGSTHCLRAEPPSSWGPPATRWDTGMLKQVDKMSTCVNVAMKNWKGTILKRNNFLKYVKFCKWVQLSSTTVTLLHWYPNAPGDFLAPWALLTNHREGPQGRELAPTLLEKHLPRENFTLRFPHKLIKASTTKWPPHYKSPAEHRLIRAQCLSLPSPHHASHWSHSWQESTRDKCLHGDHQVSHTEPEFILREL